MIQRIPLKDLCSIDITDGTHKTPTYADSGYIFLSSKNVTSGEIDWDNVMYIPEELHKELYQRVAPQKDDILLAKNGTTGVAALVDKEEIFDIYVSLALIRPDKNKIIPKYLLYAINSESSKRYFDSHLKGVGVPNLHLTHIRETPISVPDFHTQEEIIKRLDKVSDLIAKRRQQLEKLDLLVKARFVEMFGDINTNDKGWDVKPLGELCTIVRGGSPRPIEKYLGGDMPWIKIGDATDDENIYLHSTKEHIIKEGISKSRLVKSGSLIFANCGVSLGFARIITFDGCIHDGWLAMEDIDESLDKVFLLQALNQMTQHFREIAPAGTQPNLNTSIMKSYLQVVPPLELQREFIDFYTGVNKLKTTIKKGFEQLELLKKALMQEYFG